MLPITPVRLSRRALLRAGTALCSGWGATTLLAGCGGSNPAEDALPEGYSEAYRLGLTRAEEEFVNVRTMTLTPSGDLTLVVSTSRFDRDADRYFYEFRASRYTKRGQPGVTEQSDLFPARATPESAEGIVLRDAAERLFLSSHLVNGDAAPEPMEKSPVALTIFDSGGAREGSVTLEGVGDYRVNGYGVLKLGDFSVSPVGEYYAVATMDAPTGASGDASVIRWSRNGVLIAKYDKKEGFVSAYSGVAFMPDGAAYVSVFNIATQTYGTLPLIGETDGARFGEFVPIPPSVGAEGQTDAAGNRYLVSPNRHLSRVATRDQPTPRKQNILKYSPSGTQLALIRLSSNEYERTPLVIDADGTIFAASDGAVIVFRRTR